MDILNTYGGGFYPLAFIVFCVCAVIAVAALVSTASSITDSEWWSAVALFLIAGWFALLAAASLTVINDKPIRHEITLRPGYVIDAAKYEVIEQRGQIYVIEEREGAQQ